MSFFDDAIDGLKEEAKQEANYDDLETWAPEKAGQALRGIFMKAVPQPTKYGLGYRVIIKDVDTDEYIEVWAKGKVIKDAVLAASPAKGSALVFLFNGTKTSQGGNEYPHYSLKSETKDTGLWDEYQRTGLRQQYEKDNARSDSGESQTDDSLGAPY